MKRATVASLSVVGLLSVLPASLANASGLHGAIAYNSSGDYWRYWDYPSTTVLIKDIQSDHPGAGYVLFHSADPDNRCGAVVKIYDPFSSTTFARGHGSNRDNASNDAISQAFGDRYELLESWCQSSTYGVSAPN